MPEIRDVLVWIMGGLGSTVIVSYLVERWTWFQNLRSDVKKLYSTLAATVLSLVAFAVYTYVPAEVWVVLTPWWQIVVGVFAVNYGMEIFHYFDKKLSK